MFSTPEQYRVFQIPKKSGGTRQIEAPNEELKAFQRKVLDNMKQDFYISPHVHSFRSRHNVVTGAGGHVGATYVLHIDASNFFPSITWRNFMSNVRYGHHRNVQAQDLAKCFCQFPGENEPRLPQGAPTSPWLSNIYLSRFDDMMARYLAFLSTRITNGRPTDLSPYNYSRYADDITISGPSKDRLWAIFFKMKEKLERHYGLVINTKKTRMMGPGQRKIVCGIVVNEKAQPKRRWRKNLRAEIHNQLVAGQPLRPSTLGKIAYLEMCRNTTYSGSSEKMYRKLNADIVELI